MAAGSADPSTESGGGSGEQECHNGERRSCPWKSPLAYQRCDAQQRRGIKDVNEFFRASHVFVKPELALLITDLADVPVRVCSEMVDRPGRCGCDDDNAQP